MTIGFDQVVPDLVNIAAPMLPPPCKVLVVRTLEGRVRLCLSDAAGVDFNDLTARLSSGLGPWFAGPVIATDDGPNALRAVARQLWKEANDRATQQPDWSHRWPPGWPAEAGRPGETPQSLEGRWEACQVSRGKDPWLSATPARPPWPMVAQTPRITAFYGFKGGVGRTTTLAVLAWRLSRAGQRVLCVDLDLEAPGLSRALVDGDPPVEGLLYFLVQHAVTGDASNPPIREIELHGARLSLAGAGALGPTYIEKLSRLDTLHHDRARSPVHDALTALFHKVKGDYDHILIDCRAGLHDLAGLALHDLAHVDVLVGRGDAQEMDGLRVLLRGLMARRAPREQRMLVLRTLHSMPVLELRLDNQREALHDLFSEVVYPGEPPDVHALGSAHDPCPVGFLAEIANAPGLYADIRSALEHDTFNAIEARLTSLWTPESA